MRNEKKKHTAAHSGGIIMRKERTKSIGISCFFFLLLYSGEREKENDRKDKKFIR